MFEAYKKGTWLVAVSAGCDSMALLDMAVRSGVQVAVAHVNYHHQVQAEEEEKYVRAYCKEHHLRVHVFSAHVLERGNFEAQARELRYRFFAQVVKENGYEGVLVAHHQDDLLETYIMQKQKDLVPSVYGLAETMQMEGITVARPLLSCTRRDLEMFCVEHDIVWYEDETNRDLSYARNRVRHEQLANLSTSKRNELLKEIQEENARLFKTRKEAKKVVCNGRVKLAEYRSLREPVRIAVVYLLLDLHVSLTYAKQIDHILCCKEDVCMSFGKRQLVQEHGCVFMIDEPESYHLVFSSLAEVPMGLKNASFKVLPPRPGVNAVTVQEEDFPLVLRCAKAGDWIQMRFGVKKVNRFFIDRHIPRYMRYTWPVLENAKGQVIFVSGLGCDVHHYDASPSFSVLQCLHYMEDFCDE